MEWFKKRASSAVLPLENQALIADIRRAEQEWKNAEWRFQHALGEDHVDYAIFCLEAAEKKLGMLLKQAKGKWGESADFVKEVREAK
ncbi:hypothetical protein B1A99_13535 [Cohnella sp. CIP 111063]|jgi:hypothetical protein|uniref:DUF2508 family protein n=1 Tax=unclassified Cohnella TaxID=2636738 RepID=UPI000B8BB9B3|nr:MULTISPECIES: DUF2508 family protein [unclassified Cohnella]OXS58970.1 hypothetical protein B1A99_13535 [Cohnella sp. CIP 111063]PRX72072.1 uncharacterized protein DUF2508 [Cohnella sp. SGD-V74]